VVKRFALVFQDVNAALLVLFLPFTSFPLVARLIGSSMVAPLSLLPLLVLLFVWFFPYLLRRGKLPPQSQPLFAFLFAALVSAAGAFFLPFPAFKNASPLRSEIEALITLLIGFFFYMVVAVWAREDRRQRMLLRLVNWSGLLILAWAMVQGITWRLFERFPDWMWTLQGMLSSSLLLYNNRSNGFAYEPSWLAHQLNMLYLPFWLAATVSGFTVHKYRLWKISLENVLLLGGVVALLFSVSRIGLLAFLCMAAFLVLDWNIRLVKWLQNAALRRFAARQEAARARRRKRLIQAAILSVSLVVLLLFYAGVLAGAAYGLSRYDERMKKLFDISTLREKSFFHWANQLVFAERIVFWQAGWEIFGDHPILGVGPGNAGFFFADKLSAFSWSLDEIRTLMYQWTSPPNIKSLWVRILAETGMLGFAFFMSWLFVLWQAAQFLRRETSPGPGETPRPAARRLQQVIGLMGAFVLVALLIEGFSIDTFALPYYWFSFGLLTAACEDSRQPEKLQERRLNEGAVT
jgi:O-antigen ligase